MRKFVAAFLAILTVSCPAIAQDVQTGLPLFEFRNETTEGTIDLTGKECRPPDKSGINRGMVWCSSTGLAGVDITRIETGYFEGRLALILGMTATDQYRPFILAFTDRYGQPEITTETGTDDSGRRFLTARALWMFSDGNLVLDRNWRGTGKTFFQFSSAHYHTYEEPPVVDF